VIQSMGNKCTQSRCRLYVVVKQDSGPLLNAKPWINCSPMYSLRCLHLYLTT